MRKTAALLFSLFVLWSAPLCAQNAPASTDQNPPAAPTPQPTVAPVAYNPRIPAKMELSAGYTYRAFSPDASTTLKTNGGFVSAEYNVISWIGAEVEATGVIRKQGTDNLGTAQTLTIFTAMGGPRIYPLRHRRISLYGHVLIGEGYYRLTSPAFGGFPAKVTTSNGFSFEAGTGVDLRLKSHWSILLGEGDYGETSFQLTNSHQDSYRVSAGIVYLWGQK
jgi:Outer membrane protein beta-barrel domain